MELYKNKEWLIKELENKSAEQISAEHHWGAVTVYRWMKRLEIPKKNNPLYKNKEWLTNELKTKTAIQISIEQNVSEATIRRWARRFNINLRHCKFYEDENWIKKELSSSNGSISKIAKKYKLSYDFIYEICEKFNISTETRKRMYTLNDAYFNKIDNERKAYFLGFLMADGYMKKDLSSFGMILQSEDGYILEELKKDLNYSGIITYKKNDNKKDTMQLHICSIKICKSLIYLGIVPKKSGKELLPTIIPEELKKHFIRGFIDGDGHISKTTKELSFCSMSTNILYNIRDYFEDNLGIEYKELYIQKNKETKNRLYTYKLSGEKAKKVLNHIYKDATIFLTRKYKAYLTNYCPF